MHLGTQVDDQRWHKVDLSVFRDHVVLYLDCRKHSSLELLPRSPIDVNGDVNIAKYESDLSTVPLDLQWMVMSCNPARPERETCFELLPRETSPDPTLPPPTESPLEPDCIECPPGQPGLNGTDATVKITVRAFFLFRDLLGRKAISVPQVFLEFRVFPDATVCQVPRQMARSRRAYLDSKAFLVSLALKDHRVLEATLDQKGSPELTELRGLWGLWDLEDSKVFQACLDPQGHQEFKDTMGLRVPPEHQEILDRKAFQDLWDQEVLSPASEELPAIADPPVPPVKWECPVPRGLRVCRAHPEQEASQACQVSPDFRSATQVHPDCLESEVLWGFLGCQGPKGNLDQQGPPGYCEMCNYANADFMHMLQMSTVQQNSKGPAK
ncbi:hypothetical protein HPB48_005996 [Haemaphysalis longicornis]|uniref:Uncharacterized protein n=1 Tax=Haemaphysalis longicornis TaxID=44386 RepID=A0A9J6FL01_HAELO|nr:hypothetical protein HPB48_005996 [Haemaphysalis longicornis]